MEYGYGNIIIIINPIIISQYGVIRLATKTTYDMLVETERDSRMVGSAHEIKQPLEHDSTEKRSEMRMRPNRH